VESDEDIFGNIAASSAPRSGHGEVSEARRPDEEVAGSRAMQAAQPVQVGHSVSDEAAELVADASIGWAAFADDEPQQQGEEFPAVVVSLAVGHSPSSFSGSGKKRGRPVGSGGVRELRAALKEQRTPRKKPEFGKSSSQIADRAQHLCSWQSWLRPVGHLPMMLWSTMQNPCRLCPKGAETLQRFQSIVDLYLNCRPSAYVGASAEAFSLMSSRRGVARGFVSVGCAVYSASRWLWSSLLSWILVQLQRQEFKGIALILAAQWDSTPTDIGLDEFDEALASRLTATTHTGGAKKKRCAKVVQTEMSVGVLLFIDSKYVFLVGDLPCLLQVVDCCSSECYDAALKRQLYLPLLEQL